MGEKVLLREFRAEDLSRVHAWVNDESVTKYFSFTVFPRTYKDSERFLDRQLNRNDDSYVNFAISCPSSPEEYIGSVGLKNIDYINRKAEFSIVIGFLEQTGKGYGTEAARLMLRYAFDRLGLNKVYLKLIAFNDAALKSYRKSGFREMGIHQQDVYYNGQYYDQIYMEILREEWVRLNG